MRSALFAFPLAALLAGTALAQDPKSPEEKTRLPQNGDTITVKGCIGGSTIQDLDTGYTFRLKGDKALLKKIEKEHKGHSDELTGILRSSLQMAGTEGRQVGRTTISIGVAESRSSGVPREMNPILEVKSIEHRQAPCEK